MNKRVRAIHIVVATASLAPFMAPARADVGWSVDAGVRHSDNVTLVDDDRKSDTLRSVGGQIDYVRDGARIDASLRGRGTYTDYANNTYTDDFMGFATGNLTLAVVPETFLWSLDDTFGQIAVNQLQPVTPDNRQDLNTFSTGPDFIARFGTQSDVKVSGRYRDTNYEQSGQLDSETLQGSIAFRRHLSSSAFWGVVASTSQVKYDAPGDPEYRQPALYGTYENTSARQTVKLDVGANRIEASGQSFTRPLVRLDLSRRVAPSWTLNVDLGSEYQNTSDQFVSQNVVRQAGASDVGVSAAPAASYYGDLSAVFERARTRLTIGSGYSKLDYVVANGLDQRSWYGMVNLTRRNTPRLETFVDYRYENHEYQDNPLGDSRRQHGEVGLDWRLGRTIFMTAGYQYDDSHGTSTLNRYSASLFYLMFSLRQGSLNGPRGFTTLHN